MSLIVAIEPDRRQSSKLTALARGPLNVDMVVGETTERAFHALAGRVPDLVLTSLLLSPKDEAALADRLRELGAHGAHVQTLVIPMLGGEAESRPSGGLFSRLRKGSSQANRAGGCDPAVFGAQIMEYLEREGAERAALAAAQADLDAVWADEPPATIAPAPPLLVPLEAETVAALEAAALSVPATTTVDAALTARPALPSFDEDLTLEPTFEAVAAQATPTARPPSASFEDDLLVDANFELVSAPAAPVIQASDAIWAALPAQATDPVAELEEAAPEDEWEEISLDVETGLEPSADIDAETVDLEAYLRQLHAETAAAEPAIPTLDLGALRLDADDEVALWATAQTPVAETPSIDSGLELDAFSVAACEVPVEPQSLAAAALEAASGPCAKSDLDELAVAAVDLDAPAPPAFSTLTWPVSSMPAVLSSSTLSCVPPEPMPSTAMLGSGWLDVLSAIRRDIHHLRKEEAPQTALEPPPAQVPASRGFELPTARLAAQSTDAPAVESEEASTAAQASEDVEVASVRSVVAVPAPAPATLLPSLASLEAALTATLEVRVPAPASVVEPPSRALVAPSSRAPVDALTPAQLEALRPATIEAPPAFTALPTLEEAEAAISAVVFREKPSDRMVVPTIGNWGFFDPQQLELGALLAKLNERSPGESRMLHAGG